MKVFNRRENKALRQRLRANFPPAEQRLWFQLKGSQLGFKFRRQHGIGPYIVDFYCPEAKLVIEVDGDSHFEPQAQQKDQIRDIFLTEQGIRVLRFTNTEVHQNLEQVLETIRFCFV